MNRYSEMLVFVRAAEDGSFSAAARNLALTPSAVSKMIARIEDRLGVLLFRRAHRAIALTPEGESFYRASLSAIEAVEAADASVLGGHAGRETLRVRSMPIFATAALAPRLPDFCRRHPRLKVEVQLRIDPGNLLGEGMDVAIQVGALHDSSLVARRFASTRWVICAAPAYIAERGAPAHPGELANHTCLNFIPSIDARIWTVRGETTPSRPVDVDAAILSNQASMLIALAHAGMGIVRLVEFQIADALAAGDLVELFPEHQSHEEDPIFVVYQSRRHLSSRVRAFLDFLDSAFSDPPPWRHWRGRSETSGGQSSG